MHVVLLTHVFPRAADDPLGAFLLHLIQGFGQHAQFSIVAPHAAGLLSQETLAGISITRFHYAPDASETLAYTGIMHEQVAQGIGGKILFARFLLAYFRAGWAAVRQHHARLIHAHWWLPGGLVGALVSKLTRTPLIITTHGTDVEQLRRANWTRPFARFSFNQARVITCGSNYLRDQLSQLAVADPARIRVIPMPVNPLFENVAQPSPIRHRAVISSPFAILSVARLTQQKSLDTLLDALALLRTRGIDAHLKIVGDGHQRPALEQKTRDTHLENNVQFMGMLPQADLPSLYAQCDVFVLPSLREGMGLVLAEALLCGAPVIAANSGGIPDLVQEGVTGLLFPERDANALANALEKYASDPALAARLAANGRVAVLNRFTSESVAQQFLQAYESAVDA